MDDLVDKEVAHDDDGCFKCDDSLIEPSVRVNPFHSLLFNWVCHQNASTMLPAGANSKTFVFVALEVEWLLLLCRPLLLFPYHSDCPFLQRISIG